MNGRLQASVLAVLLLTLAAGVSASEAQTAAWGVRAPEAQTAAGGVRAPEAQTIAWGVRAPEAQTAAWGVRAPEVQTAVWAMRVSPRTGRAGTSPIRYQQAGTGEGIAPGRAALMSLLLPGWGQVAQGRRWGWGSMAAEALLAGAGIWAHAEGIDRRADYQRFADLHWGRARYQDWVTGYPALTGEAWPYDHHTLPPPGEEGHDYYEMIGKYDQFAPGWDDWTPEADRPWLGDSPHRRDYLVQRRDANRYLKGALTAGGLVFLNHALTSLEALIWGRAQQRLRAAPLVRSGPGGPVPSVGAVLVWRPGS